MAKAITVIQLLGGIILSKTAPKELLVRVNKKNIFLSGESTKEDGFFRITILPDMECYWYWFDENISDRSLTGNHAFDRREYSNIIKLVPCIESLVKSSAIKLPEEFVSVINGLGEAKIIEELEKLAVLFGR